jgi:hypothetical protein
MTAAAESRAWSACRAAKTAMLTIALLANTVHAEEGGSGHYFPGSMSSFIDGIPGDPTWIARFQSIAYDGAAEINREFPYAGKIAANVEAESTAIGLTGVWAPNWDLGEKWSYAMTMTIPWVDITVSADVSETPGGPTVRRSDQDKAIGDIVLIPVMFRYKVSPDLNIDSRLTFYAPTGDYEVGQLANTGKNFWTIEPTVSLMYFGQKNGREASLFFGASFNRENPDTKYKSGTQVHLDGTLAQHFPLWKGLAGAGVSGYWYRQVSGDSGEGAMLGDFKARANGLGPVVSYTKATKDVDIIGELKWIREFNNRNRLEGDILWLKIVAKF